MFIAGASMSEGEFRERLELAAMQGGHLDEWTPWASVDSALDAIAASPRPVPKELIKAAWDAYRAETGGASRGSGSAPRIGRASE